LVKRVDIDIKYRWEYPVELTRKGSLGSISKENNCEILFMRRDVL